MSSSSRADTLRVNIDIPGNLGPVNELQIDSLLENLKDKSSILILSYNSDLAFIQKTINYLQQKGIIKERIKISPGKHVTGDFADIVYCSTNHSPNGPLVKDIQRLIRSTGIGQTLALKNIQFIAGQAVLKKDAFDDLYRLYEILKADKQLKIQIEGHVCCLQEQEGDTTSGGYILSVKRAKTVYDYLIDNGIAPSHISYKGFSSWRRIRKDLSATDEEANRRVEIRIMDK